MTSITLRQPKLQKFGTWSALIYCLPFGIGWPIWLASNSGAGYGVTRAAALATLCMSMIVICIVHLKFCGVTYASVESANDLARQTAMA